MRPLPLVLLSTLVALCATAAQPAIKPTDFVPITELPWKVGNEKHADVIRTLYYEPNVEVRYGLLAEYLKFLPVEMLGKAFDACLEYEGVENPDELVQLFVAVWAPRDPKGCWDWAKPLLKVVGIAEGHLGYDSWNERPRITVQDLDAIRASKFWLRPRALSGSLHRLEKATMPREERVLLLKDVANTWIEAFADWPRSEEPRYPVDGEKLVQILGFPAEPWITTHVDRSRGAYEIAVRKLLRAKPSSAPDLISKARDKTFPISPGEAQPRSYMPSAELFMVWAQADLAGMIKWAESQDIADDRYARDALKAKGLLMTRVDETTRKRWLSEARTAERLAALIADWAEWDPKAAFDEAIKLPEPEDIAGAVESAAYGPWGGQPWNTTLHALEFLKDFEFPGLKESAIARILSEVTMLEQWGCHDIDETARFGMKWLLRGYAPAEGLIRFFKGEDIYPDEGGIIDRTFCALRIWAVVRPSEMKQWITEQNDPKMREALTWLLEQPWGGGPGKAAP